MSAPGRGGLSGGVTADDSILRRAMAESEAVRNTLDPKWRYFSPVFVHDPNEVPPTAPPLVPFGKENALRLSFGRAWLEREPDGRFILCIEEDTDILKSNDPGAIWP